MIISASYKTDIPAFYGEWFRNRLRAGYCRMINPYNRQQQQLVSLRKDDVDGFVFWTKNLQPFVSTLSEVYQQGFPFVVQYTINGYPRALETRVVDTDRSVACFRSASNRYGADSMIWRYDPIVLSTITDREFHLNNFAALANGLSGSTYEVVVSFMQLFKKTRRNLETAADEHRFHWEDPTADTKRILLSEFVAIADKHHMNVSICTQPDLMVPGAREARCIDAQRLMAAAGQAFRSRVKGMRGGCGCYESKDIGDYDTCPHGCVYCYAVRRRPLAIERYQAHDPLGDYLITPEKFLPVDGTSHSRHDQEQLPLFSHAEVGRRGIEEE